MSIIETKTPMRIVIARAERALIRAVLAYAEAGTTKTHNEMIDACRALKLARKRP
jgi:hypothetical protein